jgi:hypothetical protein
LINWVATRVSVTPGGFDHNPHQDAEEIEVAIVDSSKQLRQKTVDEFRRYTNQFYRDERLSDQDLEIISLRMYVHEYLSRVPTPTNLINVANALSLSTDISAETIDSNSQALTRENGIKLIDRLIFSSMIASRNDKSIEEIRSYVQEIIWVIKGEYDIGPPNNGLSWIGETIINSSAAKSMALELIFNEDD